MEKVNEKIEMWQLQQRLGLPLAIKEQMSLRRIKIYYENLDGEVYVAFSGGKDSTVLLHLVRSIYPDVVGVFIDSGLEFPEVREFVKSVENIIWIRPKITFKKIIELYGYPIISKEVAEKIDNIRNSKSEKLIKKRLYGDKNGNGKLSEKWKFLIESPFKISKKCCDVLKISPMKKYERLTKKKCIIGSMAIESRLRMMSYLRHGCNNFGKRAMSQPLAFWTDKDVWEYIKKYDLKYSEIYNKGYNRTGCMFCMFGVQHKETGEKFLKMRLTHPKIYEYCIEKLGCGRVLDYIGVRY